MKTIYTSSAPGKIVLLGEYAVLSGAPALVVAVDRRARIELTTTQSTGITESPKTTDPTRNRGWTIDSAEMSVIGAHATWGVDGKLRWSDPTVAHRLGLVGAVITTLASTVEVPSAHITINTGELYAATGTKLGLGGSAAMAVALAGALTAAGNKPDPSLTLLIEAHRLIQRGRGSGIDLAAALHGGVLRFQRGNPTAEAPPIALQPVTLPAALAWCAVWTGRAASTRSFLAKIANWKAAEPERHDSLIAQLANTSAAGIDAFQYDDTPAALSAVDAYARLLAQLGEASGADIVSAEHRQLAEIAAASGVSYKSCGAGGGDVGVAMTTDPERLDRFREHARTAGFQPLALTVDQQGLTTHSASAHGATADSHRPPRNLLRRDPS